MSERFEKSSFFNKVILLGFVLLPNLLLSQNTETATADTIVKEIIAIEPSNVPMKSGEIINKIQSIHETVPTLDMIKEYEAYSDSILTEVDSLLTESTSIDLQNQTTRFLSNRVVFWKKYRDLLKTNSTFLTSEVSGLDTYLKTLGDDIKVWAKTEKSIREKDPQSGILPRVERIQVVLDSMNRVLNNKSNTLLVLLNTNAKKGISIQDHIKKIDEIYVEKKNEIFVKNEPSIFSIEYRDRSKTSFKTPIIEFYESEVKPSIDFVADRVPQLVLQIALLIVIIILFKRVSNRIKGAEYNQSSVYRRFLAKILSRNVSAAFVIALFASAIMYTNRPELLKDFIVVLVIIPLVQISKTFVDKRFHLYLNILGVLIFLNIVYIIFPPDNMNYMIIMLLISILELFVLWKGIKYFRKKRFSKPMTNNMVMFLIVVMFCFALAGTSGLLYGSTTLAELTLNVPVHAAYTGLLIFTSAIILNGIFSFILDTEGARKLNFIRFHGYSIKKRLIAIVNFALSVFWFIAILNLLNLKRQLFDAISDIFTYEVIVGSASFTVGDVMLFFFVIWLSIVLSNMIKIVLEKDVLTKVNLAKGLPHTIAVMVKYSLVTIGILLAITAVGMPLSSLTVLAGAFGVGIGFGLQNIFNNIVSGFILLFERPIQIGDTIEVGQLIGKVKSIGIRASNVKTFDGADIIVPNGDLVSNQVVNWTLSDQKRRIEVLAGVAYGSDPHKVKELFEKVLANHSDIIDDPEPIVYFKGLGESSLDFRLLFWTSNNAEWLRIQSEIVFGVHDILYKEGISIPFPQMDLHLKSIDSPIELARKAGTTKK